MEADLQLINKKLRRAEAEISDRKSEETRLIVANKSLKKAVKKNQKEAHHLLFSINKKNNKFVVYQKKIKRDFRVLEVKFGKVMKENRKF